MKTSTSARYLYLAISSLALAGIYSIFLVVLRTPSLSKFFAAEVFRSALVIHVNLSVLVWMLSVASALWFAFQKTSKNFDYYVNYSNYTSWLGVILIFLSPMLSDSTPILNNYVPMLDNGCFVLGLVIFISGILVAGFLALIMIAQGEELNALDIGNICSVLIVFLAFTSCGFSYLALDKLLYPLDLHFYYEMFFWSGGHILQFCFVEIMMIVQFLLVEKVLAIRHSTACSGSLFISESKNKTIKQVQGDENAPKLRYQNIYKTLFVLNFLLVLPAFYAHFAYAIDGPEFLEFYSSHMKYCASIAPTLMFIVLLSEYRYSSSTSNNCFIVSAILFFLGGLIGILISGINVTIPAHYHGSIVGITIALMGYIYMVFGIDNKYSFYQPYIYGGGQIIHIIGLAWSGGYGVMRKLPGGIIPLKAKITMGVMGLGGLLAVIGGLMFVYICVKKLLRIPS